ncbi:MAG: WYL domain-containing protein, partial [Phycisphaerae bacterium]|nr:WYL domain-containing protein [Phycisphaerae bacterium]
MEVGRLHRVLKIITLLQTQVFYNADQIGRECGVSRRTIYRDLNMLEAAGIPLYYDRKKGGYQIHHTCFLPPVNLSVEEALSIILSAGELEAEHKRPLLAPAFDAAAKLESALPIGMRAMVGQMLQRMKVRGQKFARHHNLEETCRELRSCILHRRRADMTYISFHEEKQIRTRLSPYWLLFHGRAWYVIGHSSLHKAVRTFKLGRIKGLKATSKSFEFPKRMTLDDYLGNAWQMIREGTVYHVKLRFARLVAPNVAEVNWHKTQKIAWHDDGTITFEVDVDG